MSSSSLICSAALSRFWLFWIRNTIRKVMIVVPVLITNCQVSPKWKNGPLAAQTATINTAARKVAGRPDWRAVASAKRRKACETLAMDGSPQGNLRAACDADCVPHVQAAPVAIRPCSLFRPCSAPPLGQQYEDE